LKICSREYRLGEFERYCKEWIWVFGIKDWTCSYRYGANVGCSAEVQYNTKSRQATLLIPKTRVKGEQLRLSALHEIWHLLMADLTTMAEGAVSGDRVLCEEHKIIARMENYIKKDCVAKKSKGKKKGGCK